MNFCAECNNLLYPKEHRQEKKLYFSCRNCGYEIPADTNRVHVNDLKSKGDATTEYVASNKQITSDPTLPRSRDIHCEVCGFNEVVFFSPSDENMSLVFYCCNKQCNHFWKQKV